MTFINLVEAWSDDITPLIAPAASREFDSWSDDLGLMLDVDSAVTNPDRRNVAVF